MTLLDLKAAKMVTGTEDGLTVRKFLIAAAPAKIVDLSKLQLKVCSALSCHVMSNMLTDRVWLHLACRHCKLYPVANLATCTMQYNITCNISFSVNVLSTHWIVLPPDDTQKMQV